MSAMTNERKAELRTYWGEHGELHMTECLDEIDRQEKVILKQGMTINLLTSDRIHAAVKALRESLTERNDGTADSVCVGLLINAALNAYPEGLSWTAG